MSLHQDHSFESCIKCTVCTTYCPVAKVNPLYPGPKQAGPDGERLRLNTEQATAVGAIRSEDEQFAAWR